MDTKTQSSLDSKDDWLDSLGSQIPNNFNSFVVRAPKITLLATKTVSNNASTSTPAAQQPQISPDVFSRRVSNNASTSTPAAQQPQISTDVFSRRSQHHHTDGASDPFMRMVGKMAFHKPLLAFRREKTLKTIRRQAFPDESSARSTPVAALPPTSSSRRPSTSQVTFATSSASPRAPPSHLISPPSFVHSIRRRASVCGAAATVGPMLALFPPRRRASVSCAEQPPARANTTAPPAPYRSASLPLPHPLASRRHTSCGGLLAPASAAAESSPRVSILLSLARTTSRPSLLQI